MWKYIHIIILVTICIGIFISHTLYVLKTRQYPQMDEQHYMDMAVQFYRFLQAPSLDSPIRMMQYIPFRQPGYSLLILPFLLVFGIESSYQIALFVNGLLYIVTICALYFLAKEFFSKELSLVAACIFAALGWTLFYVHFTYSETATTTFVVLSLLFLQKSNYFQNRMYSIAFGLCFGFGILTRWVTPIFVLGPLVLSLVSIIQTKSKKRSLIHAGVALVVIIGIAIYPYLLNIGQFWGSYVKEQLLGGQLWNLVPTGRSSHFSFQSATYYIKLFAQLSIYIYVFFIAGLIIGLTRIRKYLFIMSAFLVPYVIFSFGTIIKDDRYIVPLYPVIALIIIIALNSIKMKRLQFVCIVFLLTISFYNFFGALWGLGPLGKKGLDSDLVKMPVGASRRIFYTTLVWPPPTEYSNGEKIMSVITSDMKKLGKTNPLILQMYAYQPVDNALYARNKFHRLEQLQLYSYVAAGYEDIEVVKNEVETTLNKADYLLIKTGAIADSYFQEHNYYVIKALNEALQDDSSLLSYYTLVSVVQVPLDKSEIYIYRRDKDIPKGELGVFVSKVVERLRY